MSINVNIESISPIKTIAYGNGTEYVLREGWVASYKVPLADGVFEGKYEVKFGAELKSLSDIEHEIEEYFLDQIAQISSGSKSG